jgi:hypothetical protein
MTQPDPYTCSVLRDPFGPALGKDEIDRNYQREWDAMMKRVYEEAFTRWLQERMGGQHDQAD